MNADSTTHQQHAAAVRAAVIGPVGVTEEAIRRAVLARVAGEAAEAGPYDSLSEQIAVAAYRVTDAQVAQLREMTGSDKAAFEIVMTACVGAGLARWDAAARAIEEADDAAS